MAHNVTGASLKNIYDRLIEAPEYHPLEANTFSDWSIEAGDLVTVSRENDSYTSPVHSSKLVWRGAPQMTISSTGSREREAVSKVSRKKYGRGGSAVRAQEHIYREFHSEDGYLHSYIEMTESYLRTEFSDDMNSLRGEFEVTASHLRADFEDDINSLRGDFEVTASHLRADFEDDINSLRGEFEVTASHLRSDFEDDINSLRGEFEVTASHLRADFEDDINSLRGDFEVTASHLRSDFEDDINSLRGEFEVTASHLRADFEDDINSLRGEFEVTASHLRTDFEDDINSLRGEFEVTASHLRADFEDDINSLRGDFEVTASHLRSDFEDDINSLRGEFEVTASHLRADFEDDINSLRGEFEVTASGLRSEFEDEINSVSSRITQQANKIALVVDGDGNIKAAEIAASINEQTGASTVKLSADIIDIDGSTITEWLESEDVVCDSLDTGALTVGGAVSFDIDAPIIGEGGGTSSFSCGDMIVDAEVDDQTNTLTLTRLDGSTVTFSKATSINSLTGSWSGSASPGMTMTVVTNPSTGKEYTISFSSQTANQKLSVDVDRTRDPEQITGTTNIRVPIHVYTPGTGQYDPAVDRWTGTAALNVSSLLEDKTGTNKITANGTYSPGSAYMGFSAVEIDVPSSTTTPVLTGGWNGRTFTVSSTPAAVANKGTTISSKHSYDSSIDVHYIDVDATDTGAQGTVTRAKYKLSLDHGTVSSGSRTITVLYDESNTGLSYVCNDYGNGQNAVTLNDAAWQYDGDNVVANNRNTNTVSVTTAGRPTQLTKSETVYLDTSSSWSGNTKSIYVRRSNSSGEYVAVGSVTAPPISVSGWSLGTFTAPYSYKPSVTVNGTTYTSGSSLSATGAYNAGWTAGQSTSNGGQLELYRTPTGNITFGTTYTIKAKAYSSNSATAKTDISGASLSITVPALSLSDWSLGTFTAPYSYKPSVSINGTTYTSGSSLNATSAYDGGWTKGLEGVELYRTPSGNITYGTTYTIKAKAYSSRSAVAKTDISGASISIAIPSMTTLNATSNGTYNPSGSNAGYSSVTVNVPKDYSTVRSRFNASSGSYYIEAYDNGSSTTPISGSSVTYQLKIDDASIRAASVRIYKSDGTTVMGSTPSVGLWTYWDTAQSNVGTSVAWSGGAMTVNKVTSLSTTASESHTYSLQIVNSSIRNTSVYVYENGSAVSGAPSQGLWTYWDTAQTNVGVSNVWDNNTLKTQKTTSVATTNVATNKFSANFVSESSKYYIYAGLMYSDTSGAPETFHKITNARMEYSMKIDSPTIRAASVRLYNSSGTQITSAPSQGLWDYWDRAYNAGAASVTPITNAKSRFNASSGSYYIEAFDNQSTNPISGSSVTYQMKIDSPTIRAASVRIYKSDGTTVMGSTPSVGLWNYWDTAYNAGYDADHGLYINHSGYSEMPASVTLSFGEQYNIWPMFKKKDGNYQWSDSHRRTIIAPSNPYPSSKRLRCTGYSQSTAVYTYTFSYESTTPNLFSKNTSYTFHHNNGYS